MSSLAVISEGVPESETVPLGGISRTPLSRPWRSVVKRSRNAGR